MRVTSYHPFLTPLSRASPIPTTLCHLLPRHPCHRPCPRDGLHHLSSSAHRPPTPPAATSLPPPRRRIQTHQSSSPSQARIRPTLSPHPLPAPPSPLLALTPSSPSPPPLSPSPLEQTLLLLTPTPPLDSAPPPSNDKGKALMRLLLPRGGHLALERPPSLPPYPHSPPPLVDGEGHCLLSRRSLH